MSLKFALPDVGRRNFFVDAPACEAAVQSCAFLSRLLAGYGLTGTGLP